MSLYTRRPGTQRNAALEAVGIITRPPSEFDLDSARRGGAATVVAGIRCGECDGEWDYPFAPIGKKQAVCPHCGATNRVYREWRS
jgi:hypothetical protein